MPGQWEGPEYDRAEDGLADSEGNDVAYASEHEGHGGAGDEGQRDEHGIGPVACGENYAGQRGGEPFVTYKREHAVVKQGIERYLLEQAEGEVGP